MLRWLDFRMRRALGLHINTDPRCANYRPTKPGTHVDRDCRGYPCTRC